MSNAAKKARTCEAALWTIAQRCMSEVMRSARGAAKGNAGSLHDMRIALTRLQTAIRFFEPAIDHRRWGALRREAAWLAGRSGPARDMDVALRHGNPPDPGAMEQWQRERSRQYERLRRALASGRFKKLATMLTQLPKPATNDDRSPSFDAFSTRRLEQWRSKLADKGRSVDCLSARKRHKLRLRAKRLKYALEWSPALIRRADGKELQRQAKRAQDVLGRLNDVSMHKARARSLGIAPLPFHRRQVKTQRRLLRSAKDALKSLRRLRLKVQR
ncbi:MAG: CHAD domain-containing protein [Pseudomonadota bacterium]